MEFQTYYLHSPLYSTENQTVELRISFSRWKAQGECINVVVGSYLRYHVQRSTHIDERPYSLNILS